jgi:hypothetical protein
MIQKMSRRKNGAISTHRHDEIHLCQMLPIQIDPIDAGKVDIVRSKNLQQIIHAFFVRHVSALQSLPTERFRSLPSQFQLVKRGKVGRVSGECCSAACMTTALLIQRNVPMNILQTPFV